MIGSGSSRDQTWYFRERTYNTHGSGHDPLDSLDGAILGHEKVLEYLLLWNDFVIVVGCWNASFGQSFGHFTANVSQAQDQMNSLDMLLWITLFHEPYFVPTILKKSLSMWWLKVTKKMISLPSGANDDGDEVTLTPPSPIKGRKIANKQKRMWMIMARMNLAAFKCQPLPRVSLSNPFLFIYDAVSYFTSKWLRLEDRHCHRCRISKAIETWFTSRLFTTFFKPGLVFCRGWGISSGHDKDEGCQATNVAIKLLVGLPVLAELARALERDCGYVVIAMSMLFQVPWTWRSCLESATRLCQCLAEPPLPLNSRPLDTGLDCRPSNHSSCQKAATSFSWDFRTIFETISLTKSVTNTSTELSLNGILVTSHLKMSIGWERPPGLDTIASTLAPALAKALSLTSPPR